jgi:hypothetical protein
MLKNEMGVVQALEGLIQSYMQSGDIEKILPLIEKKKTLKNSQ